MTASKRGPVLLAMVAAAVLAIVGIGISSAASSPAYAAPRSATSCVQGTPDCVCDSFGHCSIGVPITSPGTTPPAPEPTGTRTPPGTPIGSPTSTPTCGPAAPPPHKACPTTTPGPTKKPPPPPSVGQIVAYIEANLQLGTPKIRSAPCSGAGCMGAVGLPVWLWQQPMPDITQQAKIGAYTLTLSAHWTGTTWDTGDGHSQLCTSPGVPYSTSDGFSMSPDCGYRYEKKGDYTLSATAHWTVTWSGIVNGHQDMDLNSSAPIKIGEYQAVIQN